MHIQIDRHLVIPIYTQIVGQIQFGIVSGHLPSGAQLPSIRDLAQELNVAPMTITQAYQELKRLGLIEMRPGLGTFVADFSVQMAHTPVPNRPLQLRRMLRHTVAEARSMGFSEEEIRQIFLSLLTDSEGLFTNHTFVLVGLFPGALRIYADDLERRLVEDKVVFQPLTFAELENYLDYYLPRLDYTEALLVPLHQVQTLRDLLSSRGSDWDGAIIGLNFELRPSTLRAIEAIPMDYRIGIVSLLPEFVNTMIQGISSVRPLVVDPIVCLSSDMACLEKMSQQAQAIVYSSGANAAADILRSWLPKDIPIIEYLHTPNDNSAQRIRQFIAMQDETVPA